MHTFGCPAYVLDPKNAKDARTRKWDPRSHLGVYVGLSPLHASNVSMIYNLRTRTVTTQYHVIYDDDFTSINKTSPADLSTIWDKLFHTNRETPPDDCAFPQDSQWDDQAPALPSPPVSTVTTDSEGDINSSTIPSTVREGDLATPLPEEPTQKPTTRTRSGRNVILPTRFRDLDGNQAVYLVSHPFETVDAPSKNVVP